MTNNILVLSKKHEVIDKIEPLLKEHIDYLKITDDLHFAIDSIWSKKYKLIIIHQNIQELKTTSIYDTIGIVKKNKLTYYIPILILGDAKQKFEKIENVELKCLQMGANDFLKPPYLLDAFVLKIKNLMQINSEKDVFHHTEKINIGDIILDLSNHSAYLEGNLLSLTPKEFALLYLFIKKKNIVLNKLFLSETIWEQDYISTSQTIDRHVSNLRKKLKKESFRIKTIPKTGYIFKS